MDFIISTSRRRAIWWLSYRMGRTKTHLLLSFRLLMFINLLLAEAAEGRKQKEHHPKPASLLNSETPLLSFIRPIRTSSSSFLTGMATTHRLALIISFVNRWSARILPFWSQMNWLFSLCRFFHTERTASWGRTREPVARSGHCYIRRSSHWRSRPATWGLDLLIGKSPYLSH